LAGYPTLTFQFALNQPDVSGPAREAQQLLSRSQAAILGRMDKREVMAVERAEAAIWALLIAQYQAIVMGGALAGSGGAATSPAGGSVASPPASPAPPPTTAVGVGGGRASTMGTAAAPPAAGAASGGRGGSVSLPALGVLGTGKAVAATTAPVGGGRATGTTTPAPPATAGPVPPAGSAPEGPKPVPGGIMDPVVWMEACMKQFGAPKPSLNPAIAKFLADPVVGAPAAAIPAAGSSLPPLTAGAAAPTPPVMSLANAEAVVSVFTSALNAQMAAALAANAAAAEGAAAAASPSALPPTPTAASAAGSAAVVASAITTTVAFDPSTVRSVVYMTKDEAVALGVPLLRLRQVRAALAEDQLTLSLGIPIDTLPRRFMEWTNKPQLNPIVADFTNQPSQVTCMAVAAEAKQAALGYKNGHIHLINFDTGEVLRELAAGGHGEAVTSLSFSADSGRLASGSHDQQVIVWDPGTGSVVAASKMHEFSVTVVLWLDAEPSGPGGPKLKVKRAAKRILVSASMEGDLRISAERSKGARAMATDLGDGSDARYEAIGEPLDFMASPVLAAAYNPDRQYLVGVHGTGDATVWDATAPSIRLVPVYKWTAHKFTQCTAVDFCPGHEDQLLATAAQDGTLRMWRRHVVGTDTLWREEPSTQGERSGGHTASIASVHFSPDGTKLLTSGLDKKLILWDVSGRAHMHLQGIGGGALRAVLGGVFALVCCIHCLATSAPSPCSAAICAGGVRVGDQDPDWPLGRHLRFQLPGHGRPRPVRLVRPHGEEVVRRGGGQEGQPVEGGSEASQPHVRRWSHGSWSTHTWRQGRPWLLRAAERRGW